MQYNNMIKILGIVTIALLLAPITTNISSAAVDDECEDKIIDSVKTQVSKIDKDKAKSIADNDNRVKVLTEGYVKEFNVIFYTYSIDASNCIGSLTNVNVHYIISKENKPIKTLTVVIDDKISVGYTASNSIVGLPLDLPFIVIVFSIASFIASIYAVYRWVNGRNKHFVRSSKQYSIIVDIAEILGFSKAVILKSRLNELLIVNNKKSVAINAILSAIIPFYILYVYHFMNKDFAKHSIKEKLLLAELIDDIRSKDNRFVRNIIDYKQVEEKSTFLYVVLSITYYYSSRFFWY
ncbi:MAG: hypothetical protein KatS3mg003_1292 [Candidatus Nitrosocaldaceae archaeon]|nr:MAG: hypothetical protein KatS3mg003_1292 [Candidatus Nitrosocaldaceae archaeon]